MAEQKTDVAARQSQQSQQIARREPLRTSSPFRMLERFADEMDRMFESFGFGQTAIGRPAWVGRPQRAVGDLWAPDIDVSQRDNELVVRADLPGIKKEDVTIDVTDDGLIISGERRQEHELERGGVYRSERTYGSFYRTIPLPDHAMTDQAKATFKNGVLEITMPAPPDQVTRGRRLEISEGTDAKK